MISILNNNSRSLRVFLLALCVLVLPITALGNVKSNSNGIYDIAGAIEHFIASENKYTYFGLASYYNNTSYYVVNKTSATKVESEHVTILQEDEWLAVVSRLNVLAVKASGLSIELAGTNLNVDSQAISTSPSVKIIAKVE